MGYPNSVQYGYHKPDWERRALDLPPSWNEDLDTNNKPSAQAQLLETAALSLGPLPSRDDKLNYLNFYGTLCERIDAQINQVIDLFFDGDHPNRFFEDTLDTWLASQPSGTPYAFVNSALPTRWRSASCLPSGIEA